MKRNTLEVNLEIMLYPFRRLETDFEQFIKECKKEKNTCNNHAKKKLVRTIWKNIGLYSQVRSLDEIELLLKKNYPFLFANGDYSEMDIYEHYQKLWDKLSTSLIAHRDGRITFKYWKNEMDEVCFGPYSEYGKVNIYQTMSRMVSMDLFVCNYLLLNEMETCEQLKGYYSHIMLADKQLENVLRTGVSENHLHAGATIPFMVSWVSLMNCFLEHKILDSVPFLEMLFSDGSTDMSNCIYAACILRALMGHFLSRGNGTFDDWLFENMFQTEDSVIEFLKPLLIGNQSVCQWSKTEYGKELFEELWNSIFSGTKETRTERNIDYMLDLFGLDMSVDTYGENVFLLEALKYSKKSDDDTCFFRLFLTYIKIKNVVFSENVQYGQMKGLDYFKHYYHKTSSFSRKVIQDSEVYWETVLREIFQTPFLNKVEIRIAPDDLKKRIQKILSVYQKLYQNNRDTCPLLGIIVHLIKQPDDNIVEKCWKEFEEDSELTEDRIRYGALQKKYHTQMKSILSLREENPYLSDVLVGIDTASGENDTPVWVFAPIFEEARDSKSQKLFSIAENGESIQNRSLCFTFHAGEDFRHMLSGLRRIDEVITECKFHSGDRIGHGTVLGIKSSEWALSNPVVILPRGEHLENLLWVWGKYREVQQYDASLILYLEEQILKYAEEIFHVMTGIQVNVLYQAYKNRFFMFKKNTKYQETFHNDESEIFCCEVEEKHSQAWNVDKLVHALNCVCYAKLYDEPIAVGVSKRDLQLIEDMQNAVKNKVAMRGIVVEMNPSSNLEICEINSLQEHQAFVLDNVKKEEGNPIILNVNSDDPAVFHTNVANELAYLYYGLLEQGVGRQESLLWINKLRQFGMDSSFIQQEREVYFAHVDKVIEKWCGESEK